MISSVCMHGHTQSMEYRVPPLTIATSPSISIRCLFTAFRLPTSDRSWSCKNRALKFSCRRQVLFKSRCVILCRWYSQELKDSGAQVDYTPFQKEVEIKALKPETRTYAQSHQSTSTSNQFSQWRASAGKRVWPPCAWFPNQRADPQRQRGQAGWSSFGASQFEEHVMHAMLGCAARMREGFEEATCFTWILVEVWAFCISFQVIQKLDRKLQSVEKESAS